MTKFFAASSIQIPKLIQRSILLMFVCGQMVSTVNAEENPPPEKVQWTRNMGQSGLRRFYATGAELGELVNRQVSYQIANRLELARKQQNTAAVIPAEQFESEVLGYVGQFDALTPVETSLPHPFFIRTLARVAQRLEADKVHSRSDRYDLAVLYAPTPRSYVGLGLAVEQTRVDLKYVTGNTSSTAVGPRVDAGLMLNNVLALGFRFEDLRLKGDNRVNVRSANGFINVKRDLDSRRSFLQFETILRMTNAQLEFLPAGMQLGGMAGVHYLHTRYEQQTNSLGQRVNEPFGDAERLGVFRTGGFISKNLGTGNTWNVYSDLMFDHEFDNNLDHPIDDKTSTLMRVGVARLFGPGKRISLDYQRSQSWNGMRERNNFLLVAVIDF